MRRKKWLSVACVLSFALGGSLLESNAFAVNEEMEGSDPSSFSVGESVPENFTNQESNLSDTIVDENQNNAINNNFIFVDGKSAENETIVAYLSTNPLYQNLEKIWNGRVGFCRYNGPNSGSGDTPIYEWVDDPESFFLVNDVEIQDGENIYISVNNEDGNVSFFKEENVLKFENVQNKDVVTDDMIPVSLKLTEDGANLEIDPSANFSLSMDEFNSFRNDPENYGIGKREDGTISYVKKVYSAQKTLHGQYIVEKTQGDNFQFCGGQDIYALQKNIFGEDSKDEDYDAIYNFSQNSNENTDVGLVLDNNENLLLVYKGEKSGTVAISSTVSNVTVTEEQHSDVLTQTTLNEDQEESQMDENSNQKKNSDKLESMYRIISGILSGAFLLTSFSWILFPVIKKKK